MLAVLFVLPVLAASLNLEVPREEEERVRRRIKAGRDLNQFKEKVNTHNLDLSVESAEDTESLEKPHKKKTLRKAEMKKTQSEMDFMDGMTEAEKELETSETQARPSEAPFRPRMEIISSDWQVGKDSNVEVFWQRPEGEVKGVVFGATGCFHQGGDFFEQHHKDGWEFESCKQSKLRRCQGLPDNVYFFKYALARNYMVMTVTPQGKNSCWQHEKDPQRVNLALQHVLKREALPLDTKMYASGASQGGYFMYDMQKAGIPNLKCIAPQCAEMKYQTHKEHLPTMVIYMPKDVNISYKVENSIRYLQKKLNGRVAVRTPHPWAIHELMQARGFSSERIDAVRNALKHHKGPFGHKILTGNGYLVDHPGTDYQWKKALSTVIPHSEDSLVKDHSVMHHLFQVSYAEHEFTAEYLDDFIDFCEADGLKDQTHLRFGRKVGGGPFKFDVKASGVHGKHMLYDKTVTELAEDEKLQKARNFKVQMNSEEEEATDAYLLKERPLLDLTYSPNEIEEIVDVLENGKIQTNTHNEFQFEIEEVTHLEDDGSLGIVQH